MMDVTGNLLETIHTDTISVYYTSATEDRLYYSDKGEHTVNCCNFEGEKYGFLKINL